MKLKLGEAQLLLKSLKELDQDETKLAGEVRLDIVINMNRLTPVIAAFERAIQALRGQVIAAGGEASGQIPAFDKAVTELAMREEEFDLNTFTVEKLQLDDNQAVKAGLVMHLAPILKGFDVAGRAAAQARGDALAEEFAKITLSPPEKAPEQAPEKAPDKVAPETTA
jgi:hypothetical protein